ncbi:hypothetical protein [Sorangium sp. So ce128]|uniref:hypothetical protein n=1 Tax=Sorangium sp. So ce128 TaxID=3133281 RepID=UPI003F5F5D6C
MSIAPQPLGIVETSYREDDEALDRLVVLAATGLEQEVLVMRCPEETRERPRFTLFMDGGSRSSSRLLLAVADLRFVQSSRAMGIVNLHMSLSSTGANSAVAPPKM